MKSFRQAYHNAVARQNVSEDIKDKTRERIENNTRKYAKRHVKWSVVIPVAAAVVVLSCATVWATGGFSFSNGNTGHIYTEDSSGVMSQVVDSGLMSQIGTQVDKSATADNLNITVKGVIADEKNMYIDYDVQTKDGSPLPQGNIEENVRLSGPKFKEEYLECEGQKYDTHSIRLDSGKFPDKASFEAMLQTPSEIKGKEVKLVLKDIYSMAESSTDIKFKYKSLADIYKDVTPCPPEKFIETGVYATYADGKAPSYTIPAGNLNIKFSDAYPDAYIDNMGFKLSGDPHANTEFLYISIVPGSEQNAEALKNLSVSNTRAGSTVHAANILGSENGVSGYASIDGTITIPPELKAEREKKLSYSQGRIVIALASENRGVSYHDNKELALDLLSGAILVNNTKLEEKITQPGTWKINFPVNYQDTRKTFTLNKEVPVSGYSRTVKTVTLSALYMKITIYSTGGFTKGNTGIQDVAFVMKDGSIIPAGVKAGGGGPGSGEGDYEFEWLLKTAIDVPNVAGIKIWDTVIPLQ